MLTGFIFIFLTILFTVYGQLIVKNEISNLGIMPTQVNLLLSYLFRAFTNIKVLSGIFSAIFAMICWFGAISRIDLSFAYPFMSLAFPLVLLLAIVFFHEPFYWSKVIGTFLIVLGLIVLASRV